MLIAFSGHSMAEPSVPYSKLTSQATTPFLLLGRVMDESHPQWDRYEKPVTSYPHTRDCLGRDVVDVFMVDLSVVKWQEFRDLATAEVCLFRIASSIAEPAEVADWMRGQGMVRVHVRPRLDAYGANEGTRVRGTWERDHVVERSALYDPIATWLLTSLLGTVLAFSVTFDETGALDGAYVSPVSW